MMKSYVTPGLAASALVKAARRVCVAVTSRRSSCMEMQEKLVFYISGFFLSNCIQIPTCDKIGRTRTGKINEDTGVSSPIVIFHGNNVIS